MPGNHAQVGLIRLFCGRSRAARTTFSLNAWSYVVRFFLVREPGGDEVGVRIGTFVTGICFVSPGEVRPDKKTRLSELSQARLTERACHGVGNENTGKSLLFIPQARLSPSSAPTRLSEAKMATMDKEKQLEYNLAVLKRRDAAISGVIDMSGHVVLYRFSEETQSWDRRNVEGSLFVVSRSEEPKYQFVVLNRISSENLVESVSSDFQMELTDQFLLYRNDQQEISGIWFYSPSERASIAALLQSIVGGAQPTAAAAPPPTEPTAVTDDSAPANNVTQVELPARTPPNPYP